MKPLDALTILELGDSLAVRYAGRLFAGCGARVVRRAQGSVQIGYGGEAGRAYAAWLDAGKEIAPVAEEAFDAVIVDADADISGVPAGALRVDVSWFDRDGPYAGWAGSDGVIQALSGAAYGFGEPEGPPVVAQGNAPSVMAGVTAAVAALAGLIGRRRGQGPERIGLNVLEAALCITEGGPIANASDGLVSHRLGINRFWPTYPASSYRTADGWVGLTALTPSQWQALCDLLDMPEAARDERFATADGRLAHADEIDGLLAPRLRGVSAQAFADAAQARRIPAAAMVRPGELHRLEHWRARESFEPLVGWPEVQAPRLPFRLSREQLARPDASRTTPEGAGPLAGLRVLDFSMGWSGPLAARHLADLGADVVKVESLAYPDWWRGWEREAGGDPPSHEIRSGFNAVNRNKRGVTIDMRSEEGRRQARTLAAGSNVVIENFTTGVMEGFGLGPDDLQTIAPGIVSVSMGAFGAFGPLKGYRAYGSTVEQASGLGFVNGEEGWKPCLQHVAYGDAVAGLYTAFALLACLFGRDRHGGAAIDLSQVECLFEMAAPAIVAEQVNGAPVPREAGGRPLAAPAGCVRADGEDEWVYLEAGEDSWKALCNLIGREDWAADTAYAASSGRKRDEKALLAEIERWSLALSPGEAAARLQDAGIAAAPVSRPSRLGFDAQLAVSGFWVWAERRHVGRHLLGAAPYRLDGERPRVRRPAPLLGEHNDDILGPLREAARNDEAVS